MATYRQIHITFWTDMDVFEYTPQQKYFYLYLLTNPHTNQIGIYELSEKVMSIELGYSMDTVSILLQYFIDKGKIQYSKVTKEVFLVNWIKYNISNSPKVKKKVLSDLKSVKNIEFAKAYVELSNKYGCPIDTVYIQYLYNMDTEPQQQQKEEQQQEEEEQQQEEEKEQQQEEKEQQQEEEEQQQEEESCQSCHSIDYANKIISHYCIKAGILEVNVKPKDIQVAENLFKDKIPLDICLKGIDESFNNFKPKFIGDKINSIAYCEPIIRSLWGKMKAKEEIIDGHNGTNKQDTPKLKIPTREYKQYSEEELRKAGII